MIPKFSQKTNEKHAWALGYPVHPDPENPDGREFSWRIRMKSSGIFRIRNSSDHPGIFRGGIRMKRAGYGFSRFMHGIFRSYPDEKFRIRMNREF